MNKRNFLLIGGLMLYALSSNAQTVDDDLSDVGMLNQVSVPSPTVAGIARFTDVPVNLSTGAADISIPVYTISTGKITWPVTLNYNSSGIRVGENSGNTGLGWTLCAEGMVIQRVMDRKDNGTFQANGLGWTNAFIVPGNLDGNTFLDQLATGAWDGVPDIFMYNFGGNSGKFINAGGIKLLPRKNLAISSFLNDDNEACWKIVDESGNSFYFGAIENTHNRSASSSSGSPSWFLTKMVNANQDDSLVFEYEDTYLESGFANNYELNNWKDVAGINWSVDNNPPSITGTLTQFNQQTTGKQLKRILFNKGSVEYDIAWNDRLDLATTGSAGLHVPRIKNILVKDLAGSVIRAVHLEHDYFSSPGVSGILGKRLKLTSVTFAPTTSFTDLNGPSAQKYSFEYSTINLPSKQSNAIDHWGFYNGKTSNQTLIPTIVAEGFHFNGADRNTYPAYVTAGMLQKITYPTGGYTQFLWEAHKQYSTTPTWNTVNHSINKAVAIASDEDNNVYYTQESAPLIIPDDNQYDHIQATLSAQAGYYSGASSQAISHAGSIIKLYEIVGSSSSLIASYQFHFSQTNNYSWSQQVTLDKGKTYYFTVTTRDTGNSLNGTLTYGWPTLQYPPPTYIGGCRIAKTTMHDPMANTDLIKKYSYASANVFRWPKYYKLIYKYHDPDADNVEHNIPCNDEELMGAFISSNSVFNIGTGSHVNYPSATDIIGEHAEGGYTTYTYSSFDNQQIGELDASWRRGMLLNKDVYNAQDVILQKTSFHSNTVTGERFAGHTARSTGKHPCYSPSNGFPGHWSQDIYDFPVDWTYTDTVRTKDYTSGQVTLVVHNYDNPQHQQVTRSTVFYPDGSRQATFLKYATDFTFSGTPSAPEATAVKLLQDKHIHNMPLEQYSQKWLPGSATPLTLGGSYNEFKVSGTLNPAVLPYNAYALELANGISDYAPAGTSGTTIQKDSRYVVKATANEYDAAANLVTLTAQGNKSAGNIWGYRGALPIAQVKNHTAAKKIAFTSFEKDAAGNWGYNTVNASATDHITGKMCYNLNAGAVQHNVTGGGPAGPSGNSGRYVVSYWKKNGTVSVNNTGPGLTGTTVNGWTYCEHVLLDPENVSVTGTALIDELRLYPLGAVMESYTYDPLVGVTSYDNAASQIVFYEYDAMGRLSVERDIYGNISKQHSYGYQVAE